MADEVLAEDQRVMTTRSMAATAMIRLSAAAAALTFSPAGRATIRSVSCRSPTAARPSATGSRISRDGDLIDLSAIDANAGVGGNQAFVLIGAATFGGTAGELRAYQNGTNTFVEGDGIRDFQIQLIGAPALAQCDFVL